MPPRRAALALLLCLTALAGCGLGPGGVRGGEGATLRVTRDFGRHLLSQDREPEVREGQTVMRLLRAENDVKTRYGGGFVRSINGISSRGSGGRRDWFYFVNGVLADKGADQYDLSPGDTVQWDYRDWGAAMDVRSIVGAFPEPFVSGVEGKRLPTRVECEDAEGPPCHGVKRLLRDRGVRATGASLGASGSKRVIRVIVATWSRARELPSARALEQGPQRSGVFARFRDAGGRLELLDPQGDAVRDAAAGSGLVAALRPTDDELIWLVTGSDERGVGRAANALHADTLRAAFAVVAEPAGTEKLPLEASR